MVMYCVEAGWFVSKPGWSTGFRTSSLATTNHGVGVGMRRLDSGAGERAPRTGRPGTLWTPTPPPRPRQGAISTAAQQAKFKQSTQSHSAEAAETRLEQVEHLEPERRGSTGSPGACSLRSRSPPHAQNETTPSLRESSRRGTQNTTGNRGQATGGKLHADNAEISLNLIKTYLSSWARRKTATGGHKDTLERAILNRAIVFLRSKNGILQERMQKQFWGIKMVCDSPKGPSS